MAGAVGLAVDDQDALSRQLCVAIDGVLGPAIVGVLLPSAVAGALFGALCITTGSLLWPVLVHIAVALQGGAVAWSLRRT